MNIDKAGEQYWSQLWDNAPLPPGYHPTERGRKDYVNWAFHQLYGRLLRTYIGSTTAKRLIEVGCAKSTWLPYFAQTYGLEVAGLDYSATGCEQARQILQNEGIAGEIICADVFTPPASLLTSFDVVLSLGLVEHFADTAGVVAAMAQLLKPGGLMITVIPNIAGLLGSLQKVIDRAIYDIHVPLVRDDLIQAHQRAGLTVVDCNYFLPINLGILQNEKWRGEWRYGLLNQFKFWVSKAVWEVDARRPLGVNAWSSPYIVCSATKPCV